VLAAAHEARPAQQREREQWQGEMLADAHAECPIVRIASPFV
jgi:hypothetical protein